MKWIRFLCLFLLTGCTVTIEPIPKKPAKHQAKRVKHHPRPTPTPSPQETPHSNRPLELEPTERPTPMLKIPEQLGTATLISSEKIITF